ncbi:hypothetical protein SDRG_10049 [Saprolegnia diclina VS20]|uniref:Fibronectin type-III domain-containing protein n=1 Tax=Saprolegnia diclina (strain VS20) TaxID=1156394 RepID=T0RQF7_SAPDV|nr:hypothetical protein SDRG_10049 [Saprolegnia diclina VS20]EQC32302.1 hypothetical protein SDRG_10049 [Saprolegnia diclina VS20]|eukprot:XP_008614243.1 hypothetical protein SDRG_10049 [Saprolegnia diclina VS20]
MQAVDTAAAIQPVADTVATDDEARKLLKKVLEKRKAYQARAAKALRREEAARLKAAKEAERAQEAAQRALRDNASAKTSPKKKKKPELASVNAPPPPVKTPKDFEVPSLLGGAGIASETPTLTALLVVMTHFKGAHLPPIPPSARSAVEALHELLTDPVLGGLKQAQCKLLVNPSIVEFHVELASFEAVPVNGSFFLLIISHGVRVVSGPHLGSFVLFPESRLSSIEELALTAMHERKLVDALSRIPSTNKCIALDVCQDQDVAPNVTETAIKGRVHSEMATRLLTLFHEKRASGAKEDLPIFVLEACKTRTQTALYSADDHTVQSLFPRRLLDAFRGAGVSQGVLDYHGNWAEDSTKLPYIYLRDVVNYVVSRVQYDAYCYAERSKPTERKAALAQALGPSLEQTPQFSTKLSLVDFPLAFAPKPPSVVPAAPTLVPTNALTSITVMWSAPSPVANPRQPFSPILGFHVEFKGIGRACETWRLVGTYLVRAYDHVVHEAVSLTTTATAVGLLPDAGYCFRVRARNAGGWGPFSPPSPAFWTCAVSSSTSYVVDAVAATHLGATGIVAWMARYASVSGVQRTGCEALRVVVLGSGPADGTGAMSALQSAALDVVFAAMKTFTDDFKLQEASATVLGHLFRHGDVRRSLSSTQVHSAKFLLEALQSRFPATQYPSGHTTARWALRLLHQPAPRRRALGLQEAAMKIQGLYRRRQARRALRAVAAATYQAAVDPTTGLSYFYNTMTGAAMWTVPPSLRQ